MTFLGRWTLLLIALAARVEAQPGIRQNGVFNSASHIPPTLSGGALAPGARFTMLGVRFGSSPGTTIMLSSAGFAIPVQTIEVTAGRIEALLPRSTPPGSAKLVVTTDGKASKPFSVTIAPSNPGIYSRNGEGWGAGRIDNIASSGARSPNAYSNPANPGQMIAITVTGLGQLREVTVVIGNRVSKATRQGASLSAGDEELRVRIPSDVPQGCFVPLYLLETPTQASNVVTIAVKHGAGECSPGVIPKLSGTKLGLVTLFRTRMKTQDSNVESIRDEAKIVFGSADQGNETPGSFDSMVVLPPPGTCNAYVSGFVSEGLTSTVAFSAMGGLASTWDAGVALTLRRGAQSRTVGRLPNGWYSGNLGAGGAAAKRGTAGPFLEPGELIVESNGGADIGPFALKADAPAPFEWTDLEQTAVIDRHRGSTVHWRGIPGDRLVLVVATNVDQITTSTGTCICTARGSAGQLKIPAALLAHVPATQDIPGIPFDQLYVASISAKETIPVKGNGLTGAAAVGVYALGRIVEYR